jgi:dTDP-4-amino-4,6-dideoxygalactose transaminase
MILMHDFRAELEELLQKEMVAVERVLRSGWYVLGNEVKAFDKQWSERCGKQPPCQSLSTAPSGLPKAEQHASDCLSVPCPPQMTGNQVDLIIETINEFQ